MSTENTHGSEAVYLHTAICQALPLLSNSIAVASDTNAIRATNILRVALAAPTPPPPLAGEGGEAVAWLVTLTSQFGTSERVILASDLDSVDYWKGRPGVTMEALSSRPIKFNDSTLAPSQGTAVTEAGRMATALRAILDSVDHYVSKQTLDEALSALEAYEAALASPAVRDEELSAEAADLLAHYLDFIQRDVRADDLERHPYAPRIEECIESLRPHQKVAAAGDEK